MSIKLSDNSLLKTQAHINGQWVDADCAETLAVTNPATNEVIAEVAKCGSAETRRMIEAADAAQKLWAKSASQKKPQDPGVTCMPLSKQFAIQQRVQPVVMPVGTIYIRYSTAIEQLLYDSIYHCSLHQSYQMAINTALHMVLFLL